MTKQDRSGVLVLLLHSQGMQSDSCPTTQLFPRQHAGQGQMLKPWHFPATLLLVLTSMSGMSFKFRGQRT